MRNVKAIWIWSENVLSLYQRRGDSPYIQGFLLFFCPNKGCFTSEIKENSPEIVQILGGIIFFLGHVDEFVADVECNYSAIIALCLLVWDPHPADRLQSRIGVRVFSFVGFS